MEYLKRKRLNSRSSNKNTAYDQHQTLRRYSPLQVQCLNVYYWQVHQWSLLLKKKTYVCKVLGTELMKKKKLISPLIVYVSFDVSFPKNELVFELLISTIIT